MGELWGLDMQEKQEGPPVMDIDLGGDDPETLGALEISPVRSSTPLVGVRRGGDHPSTTMDSQITLLVPFPVLWHAA